MRSPSADGVLEALNEIVADGGKVERIESQYPSLEEIMIKIERD
jgi:hypothetical protein